MGWYCYLSAVLDGGEGLLVELCSWAKWANGTREGGGRGLALDLESRGNDIREINGSVNARLFLDCGMC